MSIEIFDKIESLLRLRELHWRPVPTSVKEGTPVDWDVEDAFIPVEEDEELNYIPPTNPDSEPE